VGGSRALKKGAAKTPRGLSKCQPKGNQATEGVQRAMKNRSGKKGKEDGQKHGGAGGEKDPTQKMKIEDVRRFVLKIPNTTRR